MELVKNSWNKKDIKVFQEYLKSFENKDKTEWAKNILNTSMPVLALKTAFIKNVVSQIAKGNYLEFLDLMIWEYYENTAINGFLICKIKDFDVMKKYLDIYSAKADNWATCDLLKFDVKNCEKEFFELAETYIKNDKPFVRRIGINILFFFLNNTEYIDKIFKILNSFPNETEYYVNMINSWLVCECFIKHREKTLKFLETHKLNKFTINKAVQKCRDSFRVSPQDKEMLLKFKV